MFMSINLKPHSKECGRSFRILDFGSSKKQGALRTPSFKRGCLIVFLILLIPLSLAVEIGISPPSISFIGETGKEICNKITLSGDGLLEGEDRWAKQESREIKDYTFSQEGIKIDYPNSLKLNEDKSVQICINTTLSGEYYGALIYSQDGAGVGTWIYVNVWGKNYTQYSPQENKQILTGAVIGTRINTSYLLFILLGVFLFLIILMLILIWLNNGRRGLI